MCITHVAAHGKSFSVIGFTSRIRREPTKASRTVTSAGPENGSYLQNFGDGKMREKCGTSKYLAGYLFGLLFDPKAGTNTFLRNVKLALYYMTSFHNMVCIIITALRASSPKIKACK
jgi:hypothetical protein